MVRSRSSTLMYRTVQIRDTVHPIRVRYWDVDFAMAIRWYTWGHHRLAADPACGRGCGSTCAEGDCRGRTEWHGGGPDRSDDVDQGLVRRRLLNCEVQHVCALSVIQAAYSTQVSGHAPWRDPSCAPTAGLSGRLLQGTSAIAESHWEQSMAFDVGRGGWARVRAMGAGWRYASPDRPANESRRSISVSRGAIVKSVPREGAKETLLAACCLLPITTCLGQRSLARTLTTFY